MSVTVPRLMLMACLLSSPSLSWALGLGEIHLNSALNEPMNAEIDLISAGPEELAALRATLAGKDSFARYGIDKPPFLNTLSFKVGKSKEGRDVLLVRSTDSIPEPFVTFLVEVNWARGRLMREYTVLLDPPVYTPGERASTAAPVTAASSAPSTSAAPPATRRTPAAGVTPTPTPPVRAGRSSRVTRTPSDSVATPAPLAAAPDDSGATTGTLSGNSYHVGKGDTLTKIARSLHSGGSQADIDQTMIAVYRANPDAFGGNINILKQGAVLRVPGADDITALNQSEAMSEVHRQMSAWQSGSGAAPSGHLRLVTPGAGAGSSGSSGSGSADTQALQGRVKDLEGQLADSKRLLDLKSAELSALQRKLGQPAPAPTPAPAPAPPPVAAQPPAPVPVPVPVPANPAASAPVDTTPPTTTPLPPSADTTTPTPVPAPAPVVTKKPTPPPAADSGSWLDWLTNNWLMPLGCDRRGAAVAGLPRLASPSGSRQRVPGIGCHRCFRLSRSDRQARQQSARR